MGVNVNNRKKSIRAISLFMGIVLLLTFLSKTIYNFNLPTVTVTLPSSGKLVNVIEGTSLITYSDSQYIYADVDCKIKNILTEPGQRVVKGQVLAELDVDFEYISKLKTDIIKQEQTIELLTLRLTNLQLNTSFDATMYLSNKIHEQENEIKVLESDLQALVNTSIDETDINSLFLSPMDKLTYQKAIDEATMVVNVLKKALDDAEDENLTNFDDSIYQMAINDAKINLERKRKDLSSAETNLHNIENKKTTDFDEYSYQLAISSAQTNLERKKVELTDAKKALLDAKNKIYKDFDDDSYQHAIKSAEAIAAQKEREFNNIYNMEQSSGTPDYSAIQNAREAWEESLNAVEYAKRNLEKAKESYNSDTADKISTDIKAAQKLVDAAQYGVEDAETLLKTAKKNLEIAKANALTNEKNLKQAEIDNVKTKLILAQYAYEDAERALSKATADLERARQTESDAIYEKQVLARQAYEDAITALESVKTYNKNLLVIQYEQHIKIEKDKKENDLQGKREQLNLLYEQLHTLTLEQEGTGRNNAYTKKELDFQIINAESELNLLRHNLQKAENNTIISDINGVVATVDIEKNQYINRNDVLFNITESPDKYRVELIITEKQLELINTESKAEIKVIGMSKTLVGRINDVSPYKEESGGKYKVTLIIEEGDNLLADKNAYIKIKTESDFYELIIPNYALKKDNNGYYVLVLRMENNILGKNYIAHRVSVDLLDTDGSLSAIRGSLLVEPIIAACTSSVDSGSRVKYDETGGVK